MPAGGSLCPLGLIDGNDDGGGDPRCNLRTIGSHASNARIGDPWKEGEWPSWLAVQHGPAPRVPVAGATGPCRGKASDKLGTRGSPWITTLTRGSRNTRAEPRRCRLRFHSLVHGHHYRTLLFRPSHKLKTRPIQIQRVLTNSNFVCKQTTVNDWQMTSRSWWRYVTRWPILEEK